MWYFFYSSDLLEKEKSLHTRPLLPASALFPGRTDSKAFKSLPQKKMPTQKIKNCQRFFSISNHSALIH